MKKLFNNLLLLQNKINKPDYSYEQLIFELFSKKFIVIFIMNILFNRRLHKYIMHPVDFMQLIIRVIAVKIRIKKILSPSPLLGMVGKQITTQQTHIIDQLLQQKWYQFHNGDIKKPPFQGEYPLQPLEKPLKIFIIGNQFDMGHSDYHINETMQNFINTAQLRGHKVDFYYNDITHLQCEFMNRRKCNGIDITPSVDLKMDEMANIMAKISNLQPDICLYIKGAIGDDNAPECLQIEDFKKLKEIHQFYLVHFLADYPKTHPFQYNLIKWAEAVDCYYFIQNSHPVFQILQKMGRAIYCPSMPMHGTNGGGGGVNIYHLVFVAKGICNANILLIILIITLKGPKFI